MKRSQTHRALLVNSTLPPAHLVQECNAQSAILTDFRLILAGVTKVALEPVNILASLGPGPSKLTPLAGSGYRNLPA